MPRNKRRRTVSPMPRREREAIIAQHVKQLGLNSTAEYKEWCQQHGFARGITKSRQQLQRELAVVQSEVADQTRLASRRETRNLGESIRQMCRGQLSETNVRSPQLQAVRRAIKHLGSAGPKRRALERLAAHVHSRTGLLSHQPATPGQGEQTWVDGLCALARFWQSWKRPVEEWQPHTHNTRRQFGELARYLLVDYDVPRFLDAAWFRGHGEDAHNQQRWFLHIGSGKNIRTAELPIDYTKRMAHHFVQAPDDYSIEAALRWGQIHGLGGDARLADAIRGTRLENNFAEDDFWITVFRFFIDHPMLDTVHIGPIIDYLHNQRFVPRQRFVGPGQFEREPPPQPQLSMRGRSVESLLRQVNRWHRELGGSHTAAQWPASGIEGLELWEGREGADSRRRWTIRELLSGRELLAEGRAMRHCVATYATTCARRQTSIWSMEVENHIERRRVLTVEVRIGSRLICQARGRYNELPDERARKVLQRWATVRNLTVASYI